jgi:prepilin-type processing-associated H-X9-DG protein
MDAIFPYVKSEQLFMCPSDSTSEKFVHYQKLPAGNTVGRFGSYAWNTAYAGDPTYRSASFCSLASITYPATVVTILDAGNISEVGCHNVATCNAIPAPSGNPVTWNNVTARHLDTVSTLFADGHVKSMKMDHLLEKVTDNGNSVFRYLAANVD